MPNHIDPHGDVLSTGDVLGHRSKRTKSEDTPTVSMVNGQHPLSFLKEPKVRLV